MSQTCLCRLKFLSLLHIGNTKSNYLHTASIASLSSKVLMLLVAILLFRNSRFVLRFSSIDRAQRTGQGIVERGDCKNSKNPFCFVRKSTQSQRSMYQHFRPVICFCNASADDFLPCFQIGRGVLPKVRICEERFTPSSLGCPLSILFTVLAGVSIKYFHWVSDNTKLLEDLPLLLPVNADSSLLSHFQALARRHKALRLGYPLIPLRKKST